MVRVPRRFVKADGSYRLNKFTRRPEYRCDKCETTFRSYKALKAHRTEVHSY